jgi:hypothetical protein
MGYSEGIIELKQIQVSDFKPKIMGDREFFEFPIREYSRVESEIESWCKSWNFKDGMMILSLNGRENQILNYEFDIEKETPNP